MLERIAISALVALGLAAPAAAPAADVHDHGGERERAPLLDVRARTAPAPAIPAAVQRARKRLLGSLGPQAFLQIDRVTGGVRFLGAGDRYLSGPAKGSARQLALRWVRRHLDVLGLDESDLKTLRLAHTHTAPNGVTRLIFQQIHHGIPAFDNSLRINVARDGRIVNVGGSPRTGLDRLGAPALSAVEALRAAAAGVDTPSLPQLRIIRGLTGPRKETHFVGRHHTRLTLVSTSRNSMTVAWRVWLEESSDAVWDVLVDAHSGKLLRRAGKVKWASGLAWDNYPGAEQGGTARTLDFSPWLTDADRLRGNNTHVYNDADGSEDFHTDMVDPTQQSMGDLVTPNEEIRPERVTEGDWNYTYRPVPSPAGNCPAAGCAWNHLVNGSWLANRDQDGTQVFYFVNRFHDHLARAPIAFTEAAGNFQFTNPSGQGKGGDGVYASSMDAAGQLAGRPVPLLWSDNANMLTRPEGQPPRMQMFLFEPVDALGYPFSDVSGGSDASVVYHEYTHGLTNRLVIDADGYGALDSAQAGAMGEAWSDWYAMDFLMKQGFETDTDAPGEIKLGAFLDGGQDLVRTEAIDCTLEAGEELCPRRRSPLAGEGGGGYTYEHFGRIAGAPEVHADGEIWAQALMDLRRRLVADHGQAKGVERAEAYITRALELSVDEPSFVDMRNALLQADLVAGKRDHRRIWETFAPRGLGASAAAKDGSDTAPTAAFDLPANLPPLDMLGPAVTIDEPSGNGVVRAESAFVAGTAVDDAGVVALTVNGVPVPLESATWETQLRLSAGRNAVSVVARDVEGREASATRTVLADVARPSIKLRKPVRRRGRMHVTGTVSDDTGIAKLKVAGKRVGVSAKGRFFAALLARKRRIAIVATDRAGRVSKKSLRLG